MRDARTGTTTKQKKPDLISEHGQGQQPNRKPVFHGHDAPPDPTLRHVGFAGSIMDFNDHVAAIAQAHQQTFGFLPPPGLTLDIAKSPVGIHDYGKLFPAPNKRTLDAATTMGSYAQRNGDQILTDRGDGVLTKQYPLVSEHGAGQEANQQPPGFAQLQKKYPNVQMGMLPIPGAEDVFAALRYLDSKGGLQAAVTQNGMTADEFQQAVQRGRGLQPALAAQADMTTRLQQRQGATVENPAAPVVGAALTIKDAQKQLNHAMGTTLPETGFFNEDWTKALSNWMRSADYFHKVTLAQTQQAGFGNNTTAYLKAWKAKQYSVRHHGLTGHFLNALPLQVFGHGFAGGLFEVPKYVAGGGNDPVSISLHAMTRSAGLALGGIGGTLDQAKADLAAGHEFMQSMSFRGRSFDDSLKHASDTLKAHPSWLRIFYPSLSDDPNGVVKAIDQLTNVTGDLILLGKPRFTGEIVGPGDLAGAKASTYVNRSAHWAYDYLQRGNTGRAAEMLEGGSGAKRLAAVAAPLVKAKQLTPEQFTQHLSELYATGSTTFLVKGKELTVTGPALASLRTKYLPTPGMPGSAWLQSKKFTRDFLDSFDQNAHTLVGTRANALINTVRTALEHVSPSSMHYFDENLPGAVRHFVVNNKIGDRALADKYASQVTRYQATQNVQQLNKLQAKLEGLYRAHYPLSKSGQGSEFEAALGTEAPSIFTFPAGGEKNVTGFANLARQTAKLNKGLNRFAQYRTRLVLSTGFSLLYKHAVGDFMRFVYGGGIKGNAAAAQKIEAVVKDSPELERALGVFLDRSETGETRYVLGRGGTYSVPKFQTGEAFGRKDHMVAAGGHLRRLLTDDALTAYQQSGSDLNPLVQLILHNRTYRGMWKAAGPEVTAEEYARKVYERFAEIDEAAAHAGITDIWGKGLAVVRENRGAHVDQALGKFISHNRLDFAVPSGRVEAGGFDEVTGRAISFLMKPNKYYRKRFAENVLHNTFDDLTAAGFAERDALDVGMNLASRLVRYHMLDFADRLQVEQNFRWLSWFATKHRLYWKWVIGALARSPGAAAVVNDVKNALDGRGNLNFEILGHRLSVPAARLVWVPGKEYNEVSPDAQFVWDLVKHDGNFGAALKDAYASVNGTGNIITRVDTGLRMAARTARIMSGQTPSTFEAALNGLPEQDKQRLQHDFNDYTLQYFHQHGSYPSESDVVKHVMWRATAENLWRSTLPLPVVPASPDITDQQKLVREYMMIIDPTKRRDFLDKHPGFSDHFGVWDDPKAFLHNKLMFGKYTSALDMYKSGRRDLYEQAKANGMTPQLMLKKRALDSAFQKTYDQLLIQDARSAGIDVQPGEVPGVGKVPLGPWGKLASADPQINPRHILNALFPHLKDTEGAKVYGRLQKELKAELALLSSPAYAATYPDPEELKTRKRIILQQLEVFRRYPSDALGQIQAEYQTKYVNSYWKTLDGKYAHIQGLPADERDLAYAELRSWRDSQDHPVVISLSGPLYLVGSPKGLVEKGNINLNARPTVRNPDGTVSTVRSITITMDGKFVLIPTVVGGRVVSDEQAKAAYKRTGKHLGVFDSEKDADRYAVSLHNEQAKTQNSVTFPSPIRMAWATLDPVVRNQRLRYFASKNWADLTNYEKELLGVKRDKSVTEGWKTFQEAYAAVAQQEHLQGNTVPSGYKLILAKDIDKQVAHGFLKDYLFSLKPMYERLPLTSVVQESKYKTEWHDLISLASVYGRYLKSDEYSKTSTRASWRAYLKSPDFLTEFNKTPKGFRDEIRDYGPNFLNQLIGG